MIFIRYFFFFLISASASIFIGASESFDEQIFWILRLPRTIACIAVGGGLALSGAVIQGMIGNPLADPFTLGVASAAALGGVFGAVFLGANPFTTTVISLLFTLIALTGLFIYLKNRFQSSYDIILTGVIAGFFFSALTTLTLALSDPASWTTQLGWLMGSVSHIELQDALVVLIVNSLAGGILILFSRPLDLMSVDENLALASGVNIARYRKMYFLVVSIVTAVSVCTAGVIGFVGILIPHALRLKNISAHKTLLPLSFLAGASLLLCSDVLSRIIAKPSELPVGVMVALIGAPGFLYMMKRTRKNSI